jgi:hypothetical protein
MLTDEEVTEVKVWASDCVGDEDRPEVPFDYRWDAARVAATVRKLLVLCGK